MSETTLRTLRHMAWANQAVYKAIAALPDEALTSYIVNPEWTAGKILQHIYDGAEWYSYCLTGRQWQNLPIPTTMSELPVIAEKLVKLDAIILGEASKEDGNLDIVEGEKTWHALRSTVLAEASYHATEHRAQLLDALESKGYEPIKLDDIDLWSFENFEKKNKKF